MSIFDNKTSNSPTEDIHDRGIDPLVIILPSIFIIGLIGISAIIALKYRRRVRGSLEMKGRKMFIPVLVHFTFEGQNLND